MKRLKVGRLAYVCLGVISAYLLSAFLTSIGVLAPHWDTQIMASYAAPSWNGIREWFGADIFGRSVLEKTLHGARVAISVGLISSLIATPLGVCLGAVAGYFGGWIDDLIVWVITTVSSVPSILLLIAMSYFMGKGIYAVYMSIGLTSWIGLARVIRGEFLKHKHRDYVVAAQSLGVGHAGRIFRHILPNVGHQVIISFSLQFQSAIKAEVILSYLGLGVQGQPSWGIMIDDAKLELARGVWWQLGAAATAMFFLVLALNIFGDALRDALDPKLRGARG